MIERGILMTAENVRAMIDGRKLQSRRTTAHGLKEINQNPDAWSLIGIDAEFGTATFADAPGNVKTVKSRYGGVGTLLWVREAHGFTRQCDDINNRERVVAYKAAFPWAVTDAGVDELKRCKSGELMEPNHYCPDPDRWRPAIHMHRWASRIERVRRQFRMERLQDISVEDVFREGIFNAGPILDTDRHIEVGSSYWVGDKWFRTPGRAFQALWESINGPGSWARNPWVEVVGWDQAEVRR